MTLDYRLEEELVVHFAECLGTENSPWGRVDVGFEFDYGGGQADVIVDASGELIAFEAKLTRWREALHQAYRTRCFARRSYVVLPERTARIAMRYVGDFDRRGVGLCSMSRQRGMSILLDVEPGEPLQPWLTASALDALRSLRGKSTECPQSEETPPSSKRSRVRSVPRAA